MYSNERLLTSVIDALMKLGDTEKAESFFNLTKNRPVKMIGALMKGITVITEFNNLSSLC